MEDLGRLAGEGARHHAADLGDVADADREAQQLAVNEERLEEGVLRTVQAAPIGIVVEDDVAVLDRVERDFLRAGLDQQRHAADHRGAELGAGDHVALIVGERAGEIEPLVEDRRVGRLHQQNAHLAADRHHRRIDDVHGDHVHGAAPQRCGLDGRLHDRQLEVILARIAQLRPLDAPVRAINRSLVMDPDAIVVDQKPAVGALDVFLDVVAIFREPHDLQASTIRPQPHRSQMAKAHRRPAAGRDSPPSPTPPPRSPPARRSDVRPPAARADRSAPRAARP